MTMPRSIPLLLAVPLLALPLLAMPALAQPGPPRSPEEQQRRSQWRERYFRWRNEQEQIWEEASEFARLHSPNRWMLYEQLPESAVAKERIRTAIVRRYQMVRGTGAPGDEAYELAVMRMKTEDEAWALGRDIRSVGDETQREAMRTQLRELVQEMVDRHLEERKMRIEHLKRAVNQEERRLEQDRNRKQALIDRQMQQIIDDEEHLLRQPGRGDGEGDLRPRRRGPDGPPPGDGLDRPDDADGMQPGPGDEGDDLDRRPRRRRDDRPDGPPAPERRPRRAPGTDDARDGAGNDANP